VTFYAYARRGDVTCFTLRCQSRIGAIAYLK
jgi:hypothetical protein